jgi:glutathione synthase/RimK-type ligase-like ATP-grasp enzyme
MTPAPILILSPAIDPHAAAVYWALQRNGAQADWWPSMRPAGKAAPSIWIDERGIHMERPNSGSWRSVWHRRPQRPDPSPCQDVDRSFLEREWRLYQKNLFDLSATAARALWINSPLAASRAESKLLQLQEAHDVSLQVPTTVVTNDADDVRRLIKACGRVVFKSFYPHTWRNTAKRELTAVGVTMLDDASVLPDDAVAMCPGIFQRYVDKAFDVRVTVIGDHYFAVKLSKAAGGAFLDWRMHSLEETLQVESFELPAALKQKLEPLMRRLDLVFGCIDLVVDHEGNAFFLEVNQAGQFLFVEQRLTGLPMLQAMTAMLMTGRCDYRLEDSLPVRFNDYLNSDEFKRNEVLIKEQTPTESLYTEEA